MPLVQRLSLSPGGRKSFHGSVRGQEVLLVETDPGPEGTMVALEWLPKGVRPSLAVSAGAAAALHDGMKAGDAVVDLRGLDAGWLKAAKLASEESGVRLHLGPVASVPAWGGPGWKAELASKVRASAADVWSGPLRQWCERTSTPFMAVKVVIEEASEELPEDLPRPAAPGELWRRALDRPAEALAAFRQWRRQERAARNLAAFMELMLLRKE